MIAQEAEERGEPTGDHVVSVIAEIKTAADVSTELLTASDGDVVEDRRTGDERFLSLRFPDGESLQTTYEDCADRGMKIDVRRIRHEQDD